MHGFRVTSDNRPNIQHALLPPGWSRSAFRPTDGGAQDTWYLITQHAFSQTYDGCHMMVQSSNSGRIGDHHRKTPHPPLFRPPPHYFLSMLLTSPAPSGSHSCFTYMFVCCV